MKKLKLSPIAADGWKFKPGDFHVDAGAKINAVNLGGEFHTFTRVAKAHTLSATFAIKNGVAHNDDLKAQSSLLSLTGAGNFDIGHNGIDYQAKAILAAGGIAIPVKLSGALDSPASAASRRWRTWRSASGTARRSQPAATTTASASSTPTPTASTTRA